MNGAHRLKRLMEMQTTNEIRQLNIISRHIGNIEDSYNLLQNIDIATSPPISSSSSTKSSGQKRSGRYIVLDFESIDTYRMIKLTSGYKFT